jgi:hypothetical protein
VQQGRDDEGGVALRTRECRALQGVLELIDGLAVLGQAHHGLAREQDLVDGAVHRGQRLHLRITVHREHLVSRHAQGSV